MLKVLVASLCPASSDPADCLETLPSLWRWPFWWGCSWWWGWWTWWRWRWRWWLLVMVTRTPITGTLLWSSGQGIMTQRSTHSHSQSQHIIISNGSVTHHWCYMINITSNIYWTYGDQCFSDATGTWLQLPWTVLRSKGLFRKFVLVAFYWLFYFFFISWIGLKIGW